jgi:hypothetical protein
VIRTAFRSLLAAGALAAGIAAASAAAAATTVTINETLDLTQATTSLSSPQIQAIGTGFTPSPDFNLAVGDTLDYTLDFLGNQSLQATDLFFIKAAFFSCCDSQQINTTGTLSLLDASNSVVFTSTQTSPAFNAFGQDFLIFIPNIAFSSLHYVASVDSYAPLLPGPADVTREYTTPLFQAGVTQNGTLQVAGIPEPATWALFLSGVLGLGAMLRRERKPLAHAAA